MLDRTTSRPLPISVPGEPAINPLLPLKVAGLSLLRDGRALVNGLDLSLSSNALTIVMGANGAGKTLLLRLLHGLLVPTSGRISWGGQELPNDTVRRQQAMVFQKPVLLRRSVAANMDFALQHTARRDPDVRDVLLHRVGLLDKARQPARLLSGGEQQRLALARALLFAPKALLLDEPTASLDPASTALIEEIVAEESGRGTKVILVTHDKGQARRLGDDVVFLHQGRVVEHTLAASFFTRPSSIQAQAYLEGRLIL